MTQQHLHYSDLFTRLMREDAEFQQRWRTMRDAYVREARQAAPRLPVLNDLKQKIAACAAAWGKNGALRKAGYRWHFEHAEWPALEQAHRVFELRQVKRDVHIPSLRGSQPPVVAALLPLVVAVPALIAQSFLFALVLMVIGGLLGALVSALRHNREMVRAQQRAAAERDQSYAELEAAEKTLEQMLGIPLVPHLVDDLEYRYQRALMQRAEAVHAEQQQALEAKRSRRRYARGGHDGDAGRGTGSGRTFDAGGHGDIGSDDDLHLEHPMSEPLPEAEVETWSPSVNTNGQGMVPGMMIDFGGAPYGTTN